MTSFPADFTATLLRALLGAALLASAAICQHGDEPHAGAVGALCLDCHTELRDVVAGRVAHAPVSEGDCTACHAPHAARYEHMLNRRVRALCSDCHQDRLLADLRGHVHTPVRQGDCTGCHEVHGSENRNLLAAEGNALCFGCHPAEEHKLELPTVHFPFEMGECIDCHQAHASPFEAQLFAPPSALCVECHDTDDAAVVEAHAGIPVDGARCLGCHDAHASSEAGLLRGEAHAPFAMGACDACHLTDSDTPRVLSATGGRLCLECHEGYPRPTDTVVHAPVGEGRCLECHSPHVSDQPRLLVADGRTTCLACHAEIAERQATARSAHSPNVEGGACTICHQPHSSKDEFLLSAGGIRTCLPCHELQRHGHPLGSDRLDPRTGQGITCVTCHDPHGTEFAYQLRGDQTRGLCLECHVTDETH